MTLEWGYGTFGVRPGWGWSLAGIPSAGGDAYFPKAQQSSAQAGAQT